MDQGLLDIRMFGEFSFEYDGKPAIPYNARGSKVYYLLQYLLAHRGKSFTKEALVDLLYENENVDNPSNALKIIIHRLRKLLEAYGLSSRNYLLYRNGKYSWNPDCACEIDIEIFLEHIKMAGQESCSEEERILHYQSAVNLYKGDLLPHLSTKEWVLPLAVHYRELYLSCIRELFRRAGNALDYKSMLEICIKATSIYPFDEELHYMQIYCLFSLNRLKEALLAYNSVIDMLFDEFGVHPSDELQNLYRQITEKLQSVTDSVADIRADMNEDTEEGGAYYSNYQSFSDNYRFVVRGLERTGYSAYLMLVSLVNKKGRAQESGDALADAAGKLHNAIKTVLRKGDLFTRYSTTQFLILLIGINQENCSLVFRRLEKSYQKLNKNINIHIQYHIISATDLKIPDR